MAAASSTNSIPDEFWNKKRKSELLSYGDASWPGVLGWQGLLSKDASSRLNIPRNSVHLKSFLFFLHVKDLQESEKRLLLTADVSQMTRLSLYRFPGSFERRWASPSNLTRCTEMLHLLLVLVLPHLHPSAPLSLKVQDVGGGSIYLQSNLFSQKPDEAFLFICLQPADGCNSSLLNMQTVKVQWCVEWNFLGSIFFVHFVFTPIFIYITMRHYVAFIRWHVCWCGRWRIKFSCVHLTWNCVFLPVKMQVLQRCACLSHWDGSEASYCHRERLLQMNCC